jgi:hypothetical protein
MAKFRVAMSEIMKKVKNPSPAQGKMPKRNIFHRKIEIAIPARARFITAPMFAVDESRSRILDGPHKILRTIQNPGQPQ